MNDEIKSLREALWEIAQTLDAMNCNLCTIIEEMRGDADYNEEEEE